MRAALDGHKRTQTASHIASREPNTMNSTAREGLFAGSAHNLRQKVKTASSTHRRRITMIPSEREVVDAVYNRPRMSKKSPQAFLFGQSQRQIQAEIMAHTVRNNGQARGRLWKSTYGKITDN